LVLQPLACRSTPAALIAIHQLLSHYRHLVDARDWDRFADPPAASVR
jgi:hypothetical protein